jgi:membrane protease YdiL (CAAX protease family)
MSDESFLTEIQPALLAWETVALVCLVLAGMTWIRILSRREQILPRHRNRRVPWSGLDVLTVVGAWVMVQYLVAALLIQGGFLQSIYGTNFRMPVQHDGATPEELLNLDRFELWLAFFAWPLQVAVLVLIPYWRSGALPYQLGLTLRGWDRSLLIAALAWLIVTPATTAIEYVATNIYMLIAGTPPKLHPLLELGTQDRSSTELFVLISVAVVCAPVMEELLFRGIVQKWCGARPFGPSAALAASLLWGFAFGTKGWVAELFVVCLIPGLFVVDRLARNLVPDPTQARAIYATAVLFGVSHANVWPTPIPLFVLGLVLGYLGYRTQSLLAPIALHALFNLMACLELIYSVSPAV